MVATNPRLPSPSWRRRRNRERSRRRRCRCATSPLNLTATDPTCTSVAVIDRRHIEAYKVALAARPGKGDNTTLSRKPSDITSGLLRTFFERIIDWDYPDVPAGSIFTRTGMRAGELGGFARRRHVPESVTPIGFRIPLGKLHNDRSVPLHPLLAGWINDYCAWRGPTSTGPAR